MDSPRLIVEIRLYDKDEFGRPLASNFKFTETTISIDAQTYRYRSLVSISLFDSDLQYVLNSARDSAIEAFSKLDLGLESKVIRTVEK